MIPPPKICALAACAILLTSCGTPNPSSAKEDAWHIFTATTYGFNGEVLYMGDKDCYSYFLIGSHWKHYYKKPARRTNMQQRFPLGSGHPYHPTTEEVGE